VTTTRKKKDSAERTANGVANGVCTLPSKVHNVSLTLRPSTGDYMTRDPAQSDENLYRYCGNDPINEIDPSGMSGGGIWTVMGVIGAPPCPERNPTCGYALGSAFMGDAGNGDADNPTTWSLNFQSLSPHFDPLGTNRESNPDHSLPDFTPPTIGLIQHFSFNGPAPEESFQIPRSALPPLPPLSFDDSNGSSSLIDVLASMISLAAGNPGSGVPPSSVPNLFRQSKNSAANSSRDLPGGPPPPSNNPSAAQYGTSIFLNAAGQVGGALGRGLLDKEGSAGVLQDLIEGFNKILHIPPISLTLNRNLLGVCGQADHAFGWGTGNNNVGAGSGSPSNPSMGPDFSVGGILHGSLRLTPNVTVGAEAGSFQLNISKQPVGVYLEYIPYPTPTSPLSR